MREQVLNFINKRNFKLSVRLTNGDELHIGNVNDCIVNQYEAIQRVRELHNQIGDYCGYCADIGSCCNPKDFEYPCPTIRALDGEQ